MTDDKPHSLVTKLAEVMGAMKRVPKNGRNAFFGYNYVREGDLVDAIRDELAQRRVFITCEVEDVQRLAGRTKKGDDKWSTYVKMVFTFRDGDSNDTIRASFQNESEDQGDKGTNKAITAAKKYFLLTNFLVPTGDDLDQESPVERKPGALSPKPSTGPARTVAPTTTGSPVPRPWPPDSKSGAVASTSTANPSGSPAAVEQPRPAPASHPAPDSPSKPAPVMCEVCGALVPSSRAKESQDQIGMVLCITDLKTALSKREAKK